MEKAFTSFLSTVLLLVHYVMASSAMAQNNITADQLALLSLKTQIISDPFHFLNESWSPAISVCRWVGVTCGSRRQRVKDVNRRRMGTDRLKETKSRPSKKAGSVKNRRGADQSQKIDMEPGPGSNKERDEKVLTREARIKILETQRVLNGRVFDPSVSKKPGMRDLVDAVAQQGWTHLLEGPIPSLFEKEVRHFYYNCEFLEDGSLITSINGVEFQLSEKVLGEILQVPCRGISSVTMGVPSSLFVQAITKLPSLNCAGISKKFLKGEFQLVFEFVNKVLLPRSERRTTASSVDLFVMEKFSKFDQINLPAIMIEHIYKTLTVKDGKHGLGYGYLLNKVFDYFGVKVGRGVRGSMKQTFSQTTLVECECVEGRAGNRSKSQVTDLVEKQGDLVNELEKMEVKLVTRDAEIAKLRAQVLQLQTEGPSGNVVAELQPQVARLQTKVENLTEKLLKAHADESTRIILLLHSLAPKPLASSSF